MGVGAGAGRFHYLRSMVSGTIARLYRTPVQPGKTRATASGWGASLGARKTTCLATQNGPDELFRLIGTVGGGTPTPTPTPPFGAPTPPPTPRPRPTPLPRPDTATLAAATQRKRACHPVVWAKGNFLWSQVFLWSAILASFGSAILSAGSANRILVAIFCGHSRDSHCH